MDTHCVFHALDYLPSRPDVRTTLVEVLQIRFRCPHIVTLASRPCDVQRYKPISRIGPISAVDEMQAV